MDTSHEERSCVQQRVERNQLALLRCLTESAFPNLDMAGIGAQQRNYTANIFPLLVPACPFPLVFSHIRRTTTTTTTSLCKKITTATTATTATTRVHESVSFLFQFSPSLTAPLICATPHSRNEVCSSACFFSGVPNLCVTRRVYT